MNSKIYIALLFTMLCTIFADTNYIIKNYGFKSGMSIANQECNISTESPLYYIIKGAKFKYRPGFSGGVFVEWFDESYINLVTELNYVQKGTIYDTGGVTNRVYNNRMDYLTLPVLAKLKYPKLNYLPYFLFGFRYDYLVNQNIETDILEYSKSKSGNVGTTLGLGYEFNAGGLPLLIEYTYNNQYANLLEDDDYLYTIRNLSHSFVLGYRFKDLFDPPNTTHKSISSILADFSKEDSLLQTKDFIVFSKNEQNSKENTKEISGLTKSSLIFRAMLIPGSAHFSTKRYYSGSIYSLLFGGALYLYLDTINEYNSKVDNWHDELQKITPSTLFYDYEILQNNCNDLKKEIDDYKNTVYLTMGVTAAVYLANIIDAVLFAPEDQLRINIKSSLSKNKPNIKLEMELDL